MCVAFSKRLIPAQTLVAHYKTVTVDASGVAPLSILARVAELK